MPISLGFHDILRLTSQGPRHHDRMADECPVLRRLREVEPYLPGAWFALRFDGSGEWSLPLVNDQAKRLLSPYMHDLLTGSSFNPVFIFNNCKPEEQRSILQGLYTSRHERIEWEHDLSLSSITDSASQQFNISAKPHFSDDGSVIWWGSLTKMNTARNAQYTDWTFEVPDKEDVQLDFHELFAHMTQGIVIQDVDSHIIEANQAAADMHRMTIEELKQIRILDYPVTGYDMNGNIIAPEDFPISQALRDEKPCVNQIMYYFTPGTDDKRWLSVDAFPLRSAATGAVEHAIVISTDITQVFEFEQQLSRSLEQLNLATASASVGLWDWNILTDEEIVSDTWLDILGLQRAGITNTIADWKDRVHPEELSRLGDMLAECFARKRTQFLARYQMRHGDGHWVWIESSGQIVAWTDQDKPARMIGIMRDVSAEVKLEQQLRVERERAIKALEVKSEFLATLSHEIRTPINGALGMAQNLADTPLNNSQRQMVNTIQHSTRSLLSVINDTLDYSKVETGRMEIEDSVFDVIAVIEEVVQMLHGEATRNQTSILIKRSPDLSSFRLGDQCRIRQILTNLIGNAVKFTHRGYVEIQVGGTDQGIFLNINDTGIGIPADRLATCFEPFSQADSSTTRKYGGTGLGLSISRKLARLMDGDITVSSVVGEGSSFMLELPFPASEVQASADRSGSVEITQGSDYQNVVMLIVEDNLVNQQVLLLMLKKLGCELVVVENGAQAVDIASQRKFDVILMDCQMPVMDGFAATTHIRQHGLNRLTPIVAVTANAMPSDKARCLESGMNGYIAKPIQRNELYESIKKWVTVA